MNALKTAGVIAIILSAGLAWAQEPKKHKRDYSIVLKQIKEKRNDFNSRWVVSGPKQRKTIREQARRYVIKTIIDDVFPAWMGMPWTMAVIKDGLKPDAKIPGEKGKGVSCSFFVTSVLQNAGLRLVNRRDFAGAISLPVQLSLSPRKRDLKRMWDITPTTLKKRMLKWGEGLYIVGLNCHIGFIYVQAGQVRFVHSSYTSPWAVVNEPIETSQAIANSGTYVITALFKDNRLIDHWLSKTKVPFKPLK